MLFPGIALMYNPNPFLSPGLAVKSSRACGSHAQMPSLRGRRRPVGITWGSQNTPAKSTAGP